MPYLRCSVGGDNRDSEECYNPEGYLDVKGWAFAIWLPIYMANGMYAIYAALPASWVPERNDSLIFEEIGYNFAVNIFFQ